MQDESKATYESWCGKKDAQIDWSKPVSQVYNLIRGCDPQPGAWTTHKGATIQIFDSARSEGRGAPGEILEVTPDGVRVAADGGAITLKRMRSGKQKVTAAEWAAEAGLRAGDRLGS